MVIENKPGCVEAAAQVLGDKWTPLLIRALALRPLRFCELQKEAGGVNPRTLSSRLATLERNNVICRAHRHPTAAHTMYALTSKGEDLVPILNSMATWGEKHGLIDTNELSSHRAVEV